jgi:hypothetical protein
MTLLHEIFESLNTEAKSVSWNNLEATIHVSDTLVYRVRLDSMLGQIDGWPNNVPVYNITFADEDGNEGTTGLVGRESIKVFGAVANAVAPKLKELDAGAALLLAKEANRSTLYGKLAQTIASKAGWSAQTLGVNGSNTAVMVYKAAHADLANNYRTRLLADGWK